MYVNARALGLAPDVLAGLERLYAVGVEAGLMRPCDLAASLAPLSAGEPEHPARAVAETPLE
jgi:hypothetical protein